MTTRYRRRNVWSISIWVQPELIHFAEWVLSLKITVHRINLVESDGTPGLILAARAQFPGRFFKGRVCPTGPQQVCRHALHEQRGDRERRPHLRRPSIQRRQAALFRTSQLRRVSGGESHSTLNSRRTLMRLRISALFFSLVLSTVVTSAQSSQTLTGTVSDAMCGAHHVMEGASAAQCTRECVKRGSDFALVSGDKVYTLKGGKTQLDKFAGQNVTIKGKLDGKTI